MVAVSVIASVGAGVAAVLKPILYGMVLVHFMLNVPPVPVARAPNDVYVKASAVTAPKTHLDVRLTVTLTVAESFAAWTGAVTRLVMPKAATKISLISCFTTFLRLGTIKDKICNVASM